MTLHRSMMIAAVAFCAVACSPSPTEAQGGSMSNSSSGSKERTFPVAGRAT